ncbi:transketolase family protein [Holdemania massiliensis]|uniref:transketolase family protein n=1 Tax=Holdemania massiliensis TaxID=1468449 RepID=UPI003522149D
MTTATREAYGKALAELMLEKEDIVVLDADLSKSTKTIEAKKVCPDRHFNLGIAEGNMMSVAAGLAASGKIVYASSFAVFAAGRAFEQIRNSICYPNLNVKICATHAGISVGEDGASHQAIEDLALMRSLPNMKVFQPCDAKETKAVIEAVYAMEGPCYVRLGRLGVDEVYPGECHFECGKGVILQEGEKAAILCSGLMVQETLKAAAQMKTLKPTIVNMPTIKPIDRELIEKLARTHKVMITIEEHSIYGGLGSAVAEVLAESGLPCRLERMGMQDTFGRSGKPMELLAYYGLDAKHIQKYVESRVK